MARAVWLKLPLHCRRHGTHFNISATWHVHMSKTSWHTHRNPSPHTPPDATRSCFATVMQVLRMFNLCDIGPQRVAMRPVPEPQHTPGLPEVLGPSGQDTRPVTEQDSQQPTTTAAHLSATDGRASIAAVSATPAVKEEASEVQHPGSRADAAGLYDDAVMGPVQPVVQTAGILAALRDPSSANQPVVITARQRARMADLSLLLDVILKTSSATIKKDFVACGVLNQLQQVGGGARWCNVGPHGPWGSDLHGSCALTLHAWHSCAHGVRQLL